MAPLKFVGRLREVEFRHINYAEMVLQRGEVFKLVAENPKATELLRSLRANAEFEMIFIV